MTLPPSKEANTDKKSLANVLSSSGSPPKEAEKPEVTEKGADIAKEVAPDVTQPPAAPTDPFKEIEAPQHMEFILITLPMPTKEDLKGKGPASSTTNPA